MIKDPHFMRKVRAQANEGKVRLDLNGETLDPANLAVFRDIYDETKKLSAKLEIIGIADHATVLAFEQMFGRGNIDLHEEIKMHEVFAKKADDVPNGVDYKVAA